MFFLKTLEKDLLMHPSSFGPRLGDEIKKALYASVEHKLDARNGYVITIVEMESIDSGIVQEGGHVKFTVRFKAIVFRPFRNEVFDAIVTHVDSLGFKAKVGPMTCFIHREQIPSDITFQASTSAFVSEDGNASIGEGTHIRLRVTGLRYDPTEIFAVATIKEDYLGIMDY